MTATLNEHRRYVVAELRKLVQLHQDGVPILRQHVLTKRFDVILDMVCEAVPHLDPEDLVVAKVDDKTPCQICDKPMATVAPNKRYCSRVCKDAALRGRRAES